MHTASFTPATTERFLEALFSVCQRAFAVILERDASDEGAWKRRLQTFDRNGLLSFLVASPVAAKPFEVDNSKLDDGRYRRQVIRKLKAPRPRPYMSVRLPIKREELSSPAYREDISKLLAYQWVSKLLPVEECADALLLLHQNERTLTCALDNMAMHQSTGENVARLIIRLVCEDIMYGNEKMKAILADMKAKTGPVVAEFCAKVREIADTALAESKPVIEAAAADAAAKCDAAIEKIRRDAAESEARTSKVLAECAPDPNPEESFRRAVIEKERQRRAERKANTSPLKRWLTRGLIVGVGVLLAFYLEIGNDHVTPVEAIRMLIEKIGTLYNN